MTPSDGGAAKLEGRSSAAVLPIIRLDVKTVMEVQVAFENPTDQPIRYLQANPPEGIASLSLDLFRDGKLVKPKLTGKPPLLAKHRVRELKPGERVIHAVRFRDRYGELDRGEYKLRISYEVVEGSVPHLEYGVTPLTLGAEVAYIHVE